MASKVKATPRSKTKLLKSTDATVKTPRPSDKLNPKTIDAFSTNCAKSVFAAAYSRGSIPCRLVHGSVKHKLVWSVPPETLPFDPLLITLADGIRETVHPYSFVARQGFKELLATPDAGPTATKLIPKLIMPLKAALIHSDGTVFESGIDALSQLSEVVQMALNPQLKNLLAPMSKRIMQKKYREKVTSLLQRMEEFGGEEAGKLIKAKVPTYTPLMM